MALSRAPTFPHVTQQIRDAVGCEENFPGADLSAEAVEFGKAVEAFKRRTGRRFPTLSDLLTILTQELGYSRPGAALNQLRETQTQAILRLTAEGCSTRETARRLGIGRTVVRVALRKSNGQPC